jgi:ABC-type lipoprotein release transport system permease subunit
LLPSFQQKVVWPEQKRTILLMGIRDEIPIAEKSKLKALMNAVDPGTAVLGYELAQSIGLKKSDEFKLLGHPFRVAKVHAERGNIDDITIWLDLTEAQQLLGKKGLINGILALECACAWADIGKVREEIVRILPHTKVIESDSKKALTRAEGRYRAAEEVRQTLLEDEDHLRKIRREQEAFAAILVPGVVLISMIWLSILVFSNVKARSYEIALLRALGLQTRGILMLIMVKTGLIGFLGATIGGLLGTLLIYLRAGDAILFTKLFPLPHLIGLVAGAVLLSVMAGLPPALFAASQDPANILREE